MTALRKLQRIAHQIDQDLAYPALVAVDEGWHSGVESKIQFQPRGAGLVRKEGADFLRAFLRRESHVFDLDLAGLDLG